MGRKQLRRRLTPLALVIVTLSAAWMPKERAQATVAKQVDQRYAALRISEIMYNPPDLGAVSGNALEFVELHNAGDSALALGGLRFTEGIEYAFAADAVLAPNGYLLLASSPPDFAAKYGYEPFDAYGGQLSNGGETLALAGANGPVLIQPFDDEGDWPCGPDGGDFSLVLADPAQFASPTSWRISRNAGGSPGFADPPAASTVPPIVINEVLAHTDPPAQDAIELYNPTEYDVHVGGWFLSDDAGDAQRYRLPEGAYVPAQGFLVVTEADFRSGETGFGLSENGESVVLTAAGCRGEPAGYRQIQRFGASPNGVALGRYVTSTGAVHFPLLHTVTLGETNAGPQISPVVISRIMYNPGPASVIQDEYIELRNRTSTAVPLHLPDIPELTWRIDGAGDYAFPPGVALAPGARALVVAMAPSAFRTRYAIPADVQIFGPYAGSLSNGGETIALLEPAIPNSVGPQAYLEADVVTYDDGPPWPPRADGEGPALARVALNGYGDDPANWRADDREISAIFLPLINAD